MTSIKISKWIAVPGARHCAMRYILGTDKNQAENRVAFIEKTPRVRKSFAPCNWEYDARMNWECGPKGNDEYGKNLKSRQWCDDRLKELYPGIVLK